MISIHRRRGFSLIETGVMLVVVSMVGMVAAPAVQESRSKMRRVNSTANLQQIGQSAAVYGFSNQGRLFSYSWRAGETYRMPNGVYRTFNSDQIAAARQSEEILQRLTGRIAGRENIQNLEARLPHRRFNHLVLVDFLGEELGSSKYIDPADQNQLYWAANPLEYLEDENSLPYGSRGVDYSDFDDDPNWRTLAVQQRWTFTTSYQSVPASWQPDYPNTQYIPITSSPHLFTFGGGGPGNQVDLHTGRYYFEIASPSQKVWLHEEFDREQAVQPFFVYDVAQTEKLMFDLSVNNWSSGSANSSRVEHYGLGVWRQRYVSLHQFPDPITGLGEQTLLDQRFRWTYRGLGGVDYGLAQPGRKPMRYTR
tara:strand:+ start:395 stop:1492 length:1098 start_codon:yes stop_codon:yes gene_type:complete